jgi:hypothetical protein
MSNELITQTLKMEGERFKLLLKMDKCRSIHDYAVMKADVERLTMQIETFQKVIEEWRKNRRKIG